MRKPWISGDGGRFGSRMAPRGRCGMGLDPSPSRAKDEGCQVGDRASEKAVRSLLLDLQ